MRTDGQTQAQTAWTRTRRHTCVVKRYAIRSELRVSKAECNGLNPGPQSCGNSAQTSNYARRKKCTGRNHPAGCCHLELHAAMCRSVGSHLHTCGTAQMAALLESWCKVLAVLKGSEGVVECGTIWPPDNGLKIRLTDKMRY